MSKELSQRLRAMVSQDGRCISFTGRTSAAMCQDILAAAETLSHLPDREEVARVLMAVRLETQRGGPNRLTPTDKKQADRILSLMERKA